MILEYHRPKRLIDALALLDRPEPLTVPLGGGSILSQRSDTDFAVVDLQALGLNRIFMDGISLRIGATATLTQVVEHPGTPEVVSIAIKREMHLNERNVGTMAGAVVSGDGQSPLLAVLLAADVKLTWQPGEQKYSLGEYLALRHLRKPGLLITEIEVPLQTDTQFELVSRSPLDIPLVIVAVSRWPSGRTRVVVGGQAPIPILAMDGNGPGGSVEAAVNACSQLQQFTLTREYLQSTTQILAQRIIHD